MNYSPDHSYVLTNGIVHTASETLRDTAVMISNGRIEALLPPTSLPPSVTPIDLGGQHLCPGFIDLQLNGCGGVNFNDAISIETLETMHRANLGSGTTAFLPTLITSPDEAIYRAIDVIRHYRQRYPGRIAGLHLEGPFLNETKKGIHDANQIRPPSAALIDTLCENADVISKVTLAPEQVPGQMIHQLNDAGILVSAGHTNADYRQAKAGFDAGIRFATHLFNAMSQLTGREPGMVGAIYDDPRISAGIIADGFHVAWANIRISHRLMGERLCLVTDATAAAGAILDQFEFAGRTIYYRDGKCTGDDGTLGGSALTMIQAVENTVEQVGLPLDEALRMASTYPARAMAADDRLGRIQAGYQADLAIFNDNYQVTASVVNGEYQASQ